MEFGYCVCFNGFYVFRIFNNSKNNFYNFGFLLLLFTIISNNGSVDMNTRTYFNLLFFSVAGLLGTYLTIELAKEISKKETLLTKILVYFGKNSIIILLYHNFTPIVILSMINKFISISEFISSSPVLYSLTMLGSSILTLIVIKRVPALNKIYSL
jgi:acyltransferase